MNAFRGRLAQIEDELFKRSVLMIERHAFSFCRCLEANPNVLAGSARVLRSATATHEAAFYVVWQPRNPARRGEMDAKFVGDRIARAAEQFSELAFYPATDAPGWYWCVHDRGETADAGVYLVHPRMGCDQASGCKDMNVRCRRIGTVCKHTYALRTHLERDAQHRAAILETGRRL